MRTLHTEDTLLVEREGVTHGVGSGTTENKGNQTLIWLIYIYWIKQQA